MGELLQTVQPEVEVFRSYLSQQALIKLFGHAMITLQRVKAKRKTAENSLYLNVGDSNKHVSEAALQYITQV